LGEALMLVVEGTLDAKLEQLLLVSMKQKLPAYHAPRFIGTVSHFVDTETGKINRPKTMDLVSGL
jgi:o-succinylbenzoate---CoA ligase